MRFAFISAWKDLRRFLRDPAALLVMIGIPVVLLVLLNLAFGGGGARPTGTLLVADEDSSAFGLMAIGAFSQGELANIIRTERVSREEGMKRIHAGGASAFLIIPKGAGQDYLHNRPLRLQLYTNPSQQIVPRIIQEALGMLVEAGFYIQQVAGKELRTITDHPQGTIFPEASVARLAVAFNQIAVRISRVLDPPLFEVSTAKSEQPAKPGGMAGVFTPGSLFLVILFLAQVIGQDFWKERTQGTLRRIASSPSHLASVLAGKLLAGAAVVAAASAAGLTAGWWLIGLDPIRFPLAALWLIVSGTAFSLLLSSLLLLTANERAAHLIAGMTVLPLTMLGGSFFPLEAMPAFLSRIGGYTPNGWALLRLQAILSGTISAGELLASLAIATAFIAAIFPLALRRLRGAFIQ